MLTRPTNPPTERMRRRRPSSDNDQHSAAMAECCRFRKLTKVAVEKARKAQYNARTKEAEKVSPVVSAAGLLWKLDQGA